MMIEAILNRYERDRELWAAAMVAAGHTPVLAEDGKLDTFAYDHGTHNGPRCARCGWAVCMHCRRLDEGLPKCEVRHA